MLSLNSGWALWSSREAQMFYWGVLTGYCFPSLLNFKSFDLHLKIEYSVLFILYFLALLTYCYIPVVPKHLDLPGAWELEIDNAQRGEVGTLSKQIRWVEVVESIMFFLYHKAGKSTKLWW